MAAMAGKANSVSRLAQLSSSDKFARRPDFVDKYKLTKLYACGLCKKTLLQPQQTPCRNRACKVCLDKAFGDKAIIPCPFSHDEEPCQQEGLRRSATIDDIATRDVLLKEECFCPNQPFGCTTTKPWKHLTVHLQSCEFTPEPCQNTGCFYHEECLYATISCHLCKGTMARKDLKEHTKRCERSCQTCPRVFDDVDKLLVHQKIHEPCITEAGQCFYYDYCMFQATSVEQLKTHMKDKVDLHLEAVANNLLENKEHVKVNIQKAVNAKMKPIEKVTAEIAMNVRSLADRQESSETNAMRTAAHISQQVTGKVAMIERHIKESGLDRVNAIESHSRHIQRHSDLLNDMEIRMRNPEYVPYDGTLMWHIKDYRRSKSNAIRGESRSIDSKIFYSSGRGYKMCCRAYLNGDELGRGKYLSLHLVVMRGQFDEWLQFPFKQEVAFSLLCPSNRSLRITQTFEPDGIGPYPANHPTGINISPGCPKFALQSDVESSAFLVSDNIWIKALVAPGGDEIP